MDKRYDASSAAKTGSVGLAVADALWVASFSASWGLLLAFWNTWWAFLLLPLFLGHLSGLSEFVHQTVHGNLFARSRRWNRLLGTVAAALISVDFDTYRTFHLNHHRYANTANDPERPFYKDAAYLEMVAGWPQLRLTSKLGRALQVARYSAAALASFGGDKPFVRAMRWTVPLLIAASGWWQGLSAPMIVAKVLVTWQLPLLLLLFVDIAFAQSEHYRTADAADANAGGAVPLETQYALSLNLRVPAVFQLMLLARNLHAEHHLFPSLHWTKARGDGTDRTVPIATYLRALWEQGPRN